MIIHLLLVAHVLVLGYWLGAELVINRTFRHVTGATATPFAGRDRLLSHVMDVDQHVRYALVLQAALGAALAMLLGYVPGGGAGALIAGALGVAWLVLVETVHRRRGSPAGAALARLDRAVRWVVILLLLALGAGIAPGAPGLPAWLALKLALFAGVVACGLWIRRELATYFRLWGTLGREGSSPALEAALSRACWRATAVLAGLWLLIAAIVALSVTSSLW